MIIRHGHGRRLGNAAVDFDFSCSGRWRCAGDVGFDLVRGKLKGIFGMRRAVLGHYGLLGPELAVAVDGTGDWRRRWEFCGSGLWVRRVQIRREGLPARPLFHHFGPRASWSVIDFDAGAGAVHAAEELLEQGPEGRETAGDDADVEFEDTPQREIHRVPGPVAAGAVLAQEGNAHDGARCREAAEAEDEEERHLCSSRHVDVPQHGQRNGNGKDEVAHNIEAEVGVTQSPNRLARPAGRFDRLVPCIKEFWLAK